MSNIWKPHATVAAVIEQDERFLMVEEMIHGKIQFNQPAGHLDPDESLIDAVVRETLEESAWQFKPDAVTGIYLWKHPQNGETFLRVTFCGNVSGFNASLELDTGIQQALWMTRNEVLAVQSQHRSPLVLQCIDDYLAGQRYPLDIISTLL